MLAIGTCFEPFLPLKIILPQQFCINHDKFLPVWQFKSVTVEVKPSKAYLGLRFASVGLWIYIYHSNTDPGCFTGSALTLHCSSDLHLTRFTPVCCCSCFNFAFSPIGGVQKRLGEHQRAQHQFLWDTTVSECRQDCQVQQWCKYQSTMLLLIQIRHTCSVSIILFPLQFQTREPPG